MQECVVPQVIAALQCATSGAEAQAFNILRAMHPCHSCHDQDKAAPERHEKSIELRFHCAHSFQLPGLGKPQHRRFLNNNSRNFRVVRVITTQRSMHSLCCTMGLSGYTESTTSDSLKY